MLVTLGTTRILVLHNLAALGVSPLPTGVQVIISGHTHRPSVHREYGVLFLNPGSAGPRRFHLPVSLARLEIEDERVDAEIVGL